MEKQNVVEINGREVTVTDINLLGETGALADDRVLWELLRLLPNDTAGAAAQKGIIPYGLNGWRRPAAEKSTALVFGEQANGKIHVQAFRAIIGSLTGQATSGLERVRNIRSGYHAPTTGNYRDIALTTNLEGNPRWDLLYAVVTPNAVGDSAERYFKDITTEVISHGPVVINRRTTVTLAVEVGVPGAAPARPSLPADTATTFYIPLAYIWVAHGFVAGSGTIPRAAIYEVAPCLPIHTATGAVSLAPANHQHKQGGTVDNEQSGAISATRPGAYLPPTMVGGESRIVLLQLGLAPTSHDTLALVDDSVDWRWRLFRWTAFAQNGNAAAQAFASSRAVTGNQPTPSATFTSGTDWTYEAIGFGQSFLDDTGTLDGTWAATANSHGLAMFIDSTNKLKVLGATKYIGLYVHATTGALHVKYAGGPAGQIVIWLEASAPYSNYGVLG